MIDCVMGKMLQIVQLRFVFLLHVPQKGGKEGGKEEGRGD